MEKFLKDNCVNKYRLEKEIDEKITAQWLLKNTMSNTQMNLESIKVFILCMEPDHQNYNKLTKSEKLIVNKLIRNEEIVNITLVTLFTWFGSHVGQFSLKDLQNDIKKGEKNET